MSGGCITQDAGLAKIAWSDGEQFSWSGARRLVALGIAGPLKVTWWLTPNEQELLQFKTSSGIINLADDHLRAGRQGEPLNREPRRAA